MLETITTGSPPLPALPPDREVGAVDPFLLTIAFLARGDGVDAAYLEDSSISEHGRLIVPGGSTVSWDEETCDDGRVEADALLRSVFGETVPDTNELDWVGAEATYWSRCLSR